MADEISLAQLARTVAALDQKLDRLQASLDGLSREIARSPEGLTLINMVTQIFDKVAH